jgi:serine/threonine-protein kinase
VIDLLEKAIATDPSMAPAYADLAVAYASRSSNHALDVRGIRADELTRMRAAAERAIQLDPLLAEAHSALGMARARNGQWDLAERSFRRAIEIAPNLSFARSYFAWFFLWSLGRIEEALREFRTEERNDPLSPWAHYDLAVVLLSAGRYREAEGQCEKILSLDTGRRECLARA